MYCSYYSSHSDRIRREVEKLKADFAKTAKADTARTDAMEARLNDIEGKLDRLLDILEPKSGKQLLAAKK